MIAIGHRDGRERDNDFQHDEDRLRTPVTHGMRDVHGRTGILGSKRCIVLLIMTLLLSSGLPLSDDVGALPEETLKKFSDGTSTQELVFDDPGHREVEISLENDASIIGARMDIIATGPTGNDLPPSVIGLDVTGNGTDDWAFGGTGKGRLGHQSTFENGSTTSSVRFASGSGGWGDPATMLLPHHADITGIDMTVEGNGSSYHPEVWKTVSGGISDTYLGWQARDVGDVNDDGWADIVMGARDSDRAYLYHGGPGFDEQADLEMTGTSGSRFGQALTGLGDVNDDGVDDFAVAENGTVRVFFGGNDLDEVADLNLTGEAAAWTYFGISVAGGSDLDADGHPDIAVGDFYNGAGGSNTGEVYVFKGGPTLDDVWDYNLEGDPFDSFGYTVTTGGDLDDDGHNDLIVGAPAIFGWIPGSTWVFRGGPNFNSTSLAKSYSSRIDDLFGYALSCEGDMNGDGIDDLVVGAPDNGTGRISLYWGGSSLSGTVSPDRTIYGEKVDDDFGISVAFIDDIGGDARAELLVGASAVSCSLGQNCGKTYMINGSSSPSRSGSIVYEGKDGSAFMGYWVDGVGDLEGDGEYDFIVSSVNANSGRGSVEIYGVRWGLAGPVLNILGRTIDPPNSGPLLNGTIGFHLDPVDLEGIQDQVSSAPISLTDEYGNRFIDVDVMLVTDGPGRLDLSRLYINYTPDTSVDMDLSKAIQDHLDIARKNGNAGEVVKIAFDISVDGPGVIDLSNLEVVHKRNEAPVAFIDGAEPKVLEAGQQVRLRSHGTDDGEIVEFNWTSDLEGHLGKGADLETVLNTTGVHNVTLRVKDDLGRWSEPVRTSVTVMEKNLPPHVSISDPGEGETVSGTVNITGTTLDPNERDRNNLTVQVRIDDGDWQATGGDGNWTYLWDTSKETGGMHTIEARASDGRLSSGTVSVNVTVIHPRPGIDLEAPEDIDTFPGMRVVLVFNLTNTGNAAGDFDIEATSQPGFYLELTTRRIILEPLENTTIEVGLRISEMVTPGTDITIGLSVHEIDLVDVRDRIETVVHVVKRPPDPTDQGVTITPPADRRARPGDTVSYEFLVRNTGTVSDTYDLNASSEQGWDVEVRAGDGGRITTLDLDVDEMKQIVVMLTVAKKTGADVRDTLTLNVSSTTFEGLRATAEVVTTSLGPKASDTYVVPVPWTMLTAVLLGSICLAGAGITMGTEWGKYRFYWFLLPLYSRLKKEAVLDNFKRGEINAFIKLNPATYYNEIKRHLGVSNGVLTYHLNKLEEEGYIKSKANGRYKHYFPADMKIPDKIIILNELQRGLVKFIRDHETVTQSDISEELDIPIPTVSRHLARLYDADLIDFRKEGGQNYYSLRAEDVEGGGEIVTDSGVLYAKEPPSSQF